MVSLRRAASWPTWLATLLVLGYAALRFFVAGVQFPLSQPNLGQIDEAATPLVNHLASGLPVESGNPRQYGPTFFFVLHPILAITGGDPEATSRWLYAVQVVSLGIAFAFTLLTLRRAIAPAAPRWPLIAAWLAILWLTNTPLYAIMAIKNVETWELAFMAFALYCYVRGWLWAGGFAISLAGLAKLIPLIFFYYLFLRHRRAFVYACVALGICLALADVLCGPRMGSMYLPQIASASAGDSSWALDWHENTSLKGAVAKLFGHLDNPATAPPEALARGAVGYVIVLSQEQARLVELAGRAAMVLGLLWLAWACLRGWPGGESPRRTVWEWSLVTATMLIISPGTAFEYTMLTLGASSYVLVRLLTDDSGRRRLATGLTYGAAVILLGSLIPRSILNRLTFVDALNRWTGYTHLTPSEDFQYYCFTLIGLFLLVACIWQLRERTEPRRVQRPASTSV